MLLGGGGVGKSFVIRLVSKWAEFILREAGDDPNKPKVLILGPTGMAAYLIGMTLKRCYIMLILNTKCICFRWNNNSHWFGIQIWESKIPSPYKCQA